jgi:hypothetical protein
MPVTNGGQGQVKERGLGLAERGAGGPYERLDPEHLFDFRSGINYTADFGSKEFGLTVHNENSIQRFPVKRHIALLPGRLLYPASSSLPHVADFNGIRHRWDLRVHSQADVERRPGERACVSHDPRGSQTGSVYRKFSTRMMSLFNASTCV